MVQVHASGISVRDEDAEADHPREEVERRRGKPRLVLRIRQGTARKVRPARRAASAIHQVRLPLDRHAGVPSRARGRQVPARHRIPTQVVVP